MHACLVHTWALTCLMFLAPGMGIVPFEMHQFRETCAGVLSLGGQEGRRRGHGTRGGGGGGVCVSGECVSGACEGHGRT